LKVDKTCADDQTSFKSQGQVIRHSELKKERLTIFMNFKYQGASTDTALPGQRHSVPEGFTERFSLVSFGDHVTQDGHSF
jgi:hypothetical protein